MQALASFVMRGVPQAVMLTILMAALSLLLPPTSMLSSAIVALITLRQGAASGGVVIGLAFVACAALSLLALGSLNLAIGFLLLIWTPLWLLALLLRSTRSLPMALVGGLVLAGIMLAVQLMQSTNPIGEWKSTLDPFVKSLVDAQLIEGSQQERLVDFMAGWMPGITAAGFFLQLMASMFLGRWWQALLYNPGGFRAEFHQLKLPKWLVAVLMLVSALVLIESGNQVTVPEYLLVLLVSAWFIHGLALVHGVVGRLGLNSGWLVGLYVLLLFALPHMFMILAMAGLMDTWIDFRARLRPRGSG